MVVCISDCQKLKGFNMSVSFSKLASLSAADLKTRRLLLERKLAREQKLISAGEWLVENELDGFVMEPTDPSSVGLDEATDQFDPDELVRLSSASASPQFLMWD